MLPRSARVAAISQRKPNGIHMKPLCTIFPILSAFLLTACTSVTTTKDATQMLALLGQKPSKDAQLNAALNARPYGVQNLAQQVLGVSPANKAPVINAWRINYAAQEKAPIPASLARNSIVKKLVTSQVTGGDITVGAGEMKSF